MKLHKPITALTKDNKPFVRGYTEPKPDPKDFKDDLGGMLLRDLKHAKSQIDLPVCEESVFLLKKEISEMPEYKLHILETTLEKGINIDHLIDRLKVVNKKEWRGKFRVATDELQIKILPIKEESEDENTNLNDVIEFHKSGYSNSSILKNFTIKRKQND